MAPNDSLRAELEQIHAADQAIREQAMAVVREHGPQSPEYAELRARGRELDRRHVARLLEIVEAHGWPGRSLVGERASNGAFLVLQHAPPDVQKEHLPLVREAAAAGEVASASLALLEDRIRMRDGRDQIYGTQLTRGADGKPALWPIEDAENVHVRRSAVGLEPLDDYVARWGAMRPEVGDG